MNTALLTQMIATSSIYPNESAMGELLVQYLRAHGFSVRTQLVSSGRYNLFVEKGTEGKPVLFYGHLDTVPLVEPPAWRSDPLVLTQRKGRYYGLGVYDMKGGIAAFIEACERSQVHCKMFLAVDEENISEGAWKAVRNNASFFSDVSLIISAEPNFDLGLHGVTRARTGRYVFDVIFEGIPAHIAQYKQGVDAIQKAAQFVTQLYKKRESLFGARGSVVQARFISGEAVGMSVSARAEVQVEVLSSYRDTAQSITRRLMQLTDAPVRLRPRTTPYLSGYHFDTIPHAHLLEKIIKKTTGKSIQLHARMSVGDDNVLATLGIPVITWGPDGGNAHAPNEYVSADSLKKLTSMYYEFLEGMR